MLREYIGVYQLVDYLIWDEEAAGSSPATYTNILKIKV